jgi:phage terminase large subunit-like protein
MSGFNPLELNAVQRAELMSALAEYKRRRGMRLIDQLFPDEGPYRRELYPKHLEFFAAGKKYKHRVFIAGNRVGKTVAAGTEWSYHLTGLYPAWWDGYRFDRPITLLIAGDTHETTRDILQVKMVGGTRDQPEKLGTGLIPGRCIKGYVPRIHVPGAIEKVYVRHYNAHGEEDGESVMWLRSYVQGREIFQGFELDGFWPDEECPPEVYQEGQVRLMTTRGLSTLSFTPLEGLTELVSGFMGPPEDNENASRFVVSCGWDDVPHLDEVAKRELLANLPPHQKDARSKGIPQLGAGAIYPVLPEDIEVDDFELPTHWHRGYGMDVGWNRTACLWGAWDRTADVIYVYSEHYRGQAEPILHAAAVKARGQSMQGAIDPASKGRQQADGKQLLKMYRDLGLNLHEANNGVEAGIYDVWQRLSTGRLKFFKSCRNTMAEFKIYRRDLNGKIVKANDHAMDALRYLIATPRVFAPVVSEYERQQILEQETADQGVFIPFDPGMNM